MEITVPFYTDTLKGLIKHEVKFILIGGLAVSFHGYSRYTGDMDLWMEPEIKNLENLYDALKGMGYPEKEVNEIKLNRKISDPTPIRLKDDHYKLKVDLMTGTFQRKFSGTRFKKFQYHSY